MSIWPNGTFVGNALNNITASFTSFSGDNNLEPAGNPKDKLPDAPAVRHRRPALSP